MNTHQMVSIPGPSETGINFWVPDGKTGVKFLVISMCQTKKKRRQMVEGKKKYNRRTKYYVKLVRGRCQSSESN